ncbi:MAG: hypothetical protein LQ338_003854 [Usnochroma carphineum]|nr:MAG: hypothetical protein LQ338_003854 [Usnochroma carphineum]
MPDDYTPLPRSSLETVDVEHDTKLGKSPRAFLRKWTTLMLALNLFVSMLLTALLFGVSQAGGNRSESHTGLGTQPLRSIPFQWWTVFSSPNMKDDEAVEIAWDAIPRDFGLVAVDHVWAEKKGAPPTMDLPSNPMKGIYVVEAYHTLHCLLCESDSDGLPGNITGGQDGQN